MYEEILSKVRTKQEAEQLRDEVQTLLDALFKQGDQFEEHLAGRVGLRFSAIIRKDTSGDVDKKEYLEGLKVKLDDMGSISLALAFEPSERNIDKFHSFVSEKAKDKPVVLDISYDPSLLGGAVITYDGEYRDFSLRKIFDQEFEAMKGELLKPISNGKV